MENVSCSPPIADISTYKSYRFELGLGWYGKYDGYDLAALSLLSHGPPVRNPVASGALCLLLSSSIY
jgi:hypothetical protein